MSEITTDIIIPIVTAIVGAIVGVLTQNLIFKEKKDASINNAINGVQILNFTEIHIQQNRIIKEQKSSKQQRERRSSETADTDAWLYFGGALFASLMLIYLYLKYQTEIQDGILLVSIFIVSMCLSAIYVIKKKNIEIDKKLKKVILWMGISIIFVPIELYLLKNPIYYNTIDKDAILAAMRNDGLASLFSQGSDTFGFLLYQAVGVILIILFILHLLIVNVHIWAMINLSIKSKAEFIWNFLYKTTYPFCKSIKSFIIPSSVLLISGFLFVSGILATFLSYLGRFTSTFS